MNIINIFFNELKSFIIDYYEAIYPTETNENLDNTPPTTIYIFFNELKSFIIDYHEAIYPSGSNVNLDNTFPTTIYTFFTKIFYLFFMKPDNDYIEEKKNVGDVKKNYDDKYDIKYDMLKTNKLDEDDIKILPNKYVMEYTPIGNVVMFFDYDKKAFQYYSDFSVPYKYLECVSKKFCIMNKNRVYRDIKMEVDVNDFSIVRNSSSSLQNKSKSFAKLKSYNNSNTSIKGVPSTKHTELKIIQKDIVRYTHLGKLSNFSFVKNTISKFKPISYKDYVKTISQPDGWVVY